MRTREICFEQKASIQVWLSVNLSGSLSEPLNYCKVRQKTGISQFQVVWLFITSIKTEGHCIFGTTMNFGQFASSFSQLVSLLSSTVLDCPTSHYLSRFRSRMNRCS